MTSYVEGALVKDQKIVHNGHISLWSLWHLMALGLVLLPAFGPGLIFWMMAYVRYKTTERAVTTKRVIVKFGFIRRRTVEININKVESIKSIKRSPGGCSISAPWSSRGRVTLKHPLPASRRPWNFAGRSLMRKTRGKAGPDAILFA